MFREQVRDTNSEMKQLNKQLKEMQVKAIGFSSLKAKIQPNMYSEKCLPLMGDRDINFFPNETNRREKNVSNRRPKLQLSSIFSDDSEELSPSEKTTTKKNPNIDEVVMKKKKKDKSYK